MVARNKLNYRQMKQVSINQVNAFQTLSKNKPRNPNSVPDQHSGLLGDCTTTLHKDRHNAVWQY